MKKAILTVILSAIAAFSMPIEVQATDRVKSGKSVSMKSQKKTVKAGKKHMKGLKKASKVVNKRLSSKGGR